MKKLVLAFLLFSSSLSAFSQSCEDVIEHSLLRREAVRSIGSAAGVVIGMFALSPITTPLGGAVFGSFALSLLAAGEGGHYIEKSKVILPAPVKQLMIIDEIQNPGTDLRLENSTGAKVLFRDVGYKYTFTAEAKRELFDSFVAHLKKRADRRGINSEIDDKNVRSFLDLALSISDRLCTGPLFGKKRALSMRAFENRILNII